MRNGATRQNQRGRSRAIVATAVACALLAVTSAASGADDRRDAIAQLLDAQQFAPAAVLIDQHLSDHPDDAIMLYNAACATAQLGRLDDAETHLRAAVKRGFLRFSLMRRDPDLQPLRDRPIYRSIMAARDAADNLLAERRNTHWLEELDDPAYRLTRDESRHIDVISAVAEADLPGVMAHIGATADALERFFGQPLPHRVTIVVISAEDAEAMFGHARIRGNYRHERRELVITNLGRSLRHELAHAFHHAHMDAIGQDQPIWVQEGLACLFEAYDELDDGVLRFLPNDRQTMMKHFIERNTFDAGWVELLHTSDAAFRQSAHEHYPFARSVFEYIAAHGSVQRWYQRYVAGFQDDPSGAAALEAELAAPLAESELAWRLWVLSRDAVQRPAEQHVAAAPRATRRIVMDRRTREIGSDDEQTLVVEQPSAVASALYDDIRPTVLAGEYETALPVLRRVVELAPEHADARYDLALACIVIGDVDSAWAQHDALQPLDANLARLVRACLKPRSNP